jgi:hypothetical protein
MDAALGKALGQGLKRIGAATVPRRGRVRRLSVRLSFSAATATSAIGRGLGQRSKARPSLAPLRPVVRRLRFACRRHSDVYRPNESASAAKAMISARSFTR